MPWTIRFIDKPPLYPKNDKYFGGTVCFDKLQVGDLCYYHHKGKPWPDWEQLEKMHLTAHYFAANGNRPPLILALPDKASPNGKLYFMVDGQCYSSQCVTCGQGRKACKCGDAYVAKGHYDGWTVSGNPPLITVSPSVNYDDDEYNVKHYHGFIQAGIIGDG